MDDKYLTVCGSGAVTVLDGSQLLATDLAEVEKNGPVAVSGLLLHVLTAGCGYEWRTSTALIPERTFLEE